MVRRDGRVSRVAGCGGGTDERQAPNEGYSMGDPMSYFEFNHTNHN